MRKKIVSVLLAVTAALGCVTLLTSCGGAQVGRRRNGNDRAACVRQKICGIWIDCKGFGKTVHFVFQKDGTGTYTYFYEYTSEYGSSYNYTEAYTVTFKYFLNGAYADMFYDSVEYASADTKHTDLKKWKRSYLFDENFLRSGETGEIWYISEDFLSKIPNFGK